MRRAARILTAVTAACAVAAGSVVAVTVSVERSQEARYMARWEEQTPLLVSAVERVRLPEGYEPVACDAEEGTVAHCWRAPVSPEEALVDLEQALTTADMGLLGSGCDRLPLSEDLLGCSAQGLPYERGEEALLERVVAAVADWEVPPLRDSPGRGSQVRVFALVEHPTG